jgi:uncharacterized protein (TIGR03086 family)
VALEWLALARRAMQEFGSRVDAVTDWSAPTPDTDWDVADLVRHVVVEQQWIPPLLSGLSLAEAGDRVRPLGADLAAEWHRFAGLAAAAWEVAPLAAPVRLSYGTVTVEHYLREQVSDITIHSWDLARAAGLDETLDGALVEAVWEVFDAQREMLSASGLFAAPVEVPPEAPLQTRLLALTGRDADSPRGAGPTGG